MGLVKFGNTTLQIAEVPGGHVIVSQSDFDRQAQVGNELLRIKSLIPPGIPESQIGALLDKGQRYDAVSTENTSLKSEKTSLEQKVNSFSNIPKDFTVDKWNNFVKQEQSQIRNAKMEKLTKQIFDEQVKEHGVGAKIDPRFISPDVLSSFDFDAQDAHDKWDKVLESAHGAQLEFLKNQGIEPSNLQTPGQPANQSPFAFPQIKGDAAGEGGIKVAGFSN